MRKNLALSLTFWFSAATASVTAIDSDGRHVTLAAPAQRIVSLAPHITELLYAAGAGAKLVAASEYSDFPEVAKRLPRVASSGGLDVEHVLALHADLTVAWRLEATAKALARLESLGIPVFYSEPHRLDQIPGAIEALGVLAGTETVARLHASRLRADLEELRATYRGRTSIDVFYQIADRPLMTLNGQHFVSNALALCGGRNVFADASIIAPAVSIEAVMAADPAVIIAARADPADTSWRASWLRFPHLRAVRDGSLFELKAEEMHRHGPRAIAATANLCNLLDKARSRALKAANPR